jgi:hypothetical protein
MQTDEIRLRQQEIITKYAVKIVMKQADMGNGGGNSGHNLANRQSSHSATYDNTTLETNQYKCGVMLNAPSW